MSIVERAPGIVGLRSPDMSFALFPKRDTPLQTISFVGYKRRGCESAVLALLVSVMTTAHASHDISACSNIGCPCDGRYVARVYVSRSMVDGTQSMRHETARS